MKAQDGRFTIRQVAEATGLSLHALRYYERIGLIHPIGRAENTHRRYSTEDIGWIEFLTKLRATGMSIRQMLAYADLQRKGEETLPERLAMLQEHRRKVEAYMDELREHLRLICRKIEFYQARLPGNRVNHDADRAHAHESPEE